MEIKVQVDILSQCPRHPVKIEVFVSDKALCLQVTEEDAIKLMDFLFRGYDNEPRPIWIGPTANDHGCKIEWSSSRFVTMKLFDLSNTDMGTDFVIDAFTATYMGSVIANCLTSVMWSKLASKLSEVDPLVNAKKRMDDNLRGIFR